MAQAWQVVFFWVVAAGMVAAAVRVVTTSNVVHAALYLVGTLLGAAALYVLLFAEFVAWVQVLVYVGAIVVLMLFGLMLTRAPIGRANFDNDQRGLAALCALAVFGVTAWIVVDAFGGRRIDMAPTAQAAGEEVARGAPTTRSIGEVIFSAYVLPFEAVSVLLLAALVGAIVIARREA